MTRTTTLFPTLVVALSFALGCGDDSGRTPDASVLDGAVPDVLAPDAPGTDGDVDGGPACTDLDNDGYGDGCALGLDCNDEDDGINPGSVDVCNGIDDNCDDVVDEEFVAPGCALTRRRVCGGRRPLRCRRGARVRYERLRRRF